MGFTVPRSSPSRAVGSYPTVSPLPVARKIAPVGGLFSVALSIGSPRLGVTQHFALWSSDFPHPKRDAAIRPACKANLRIYESTNLRIYESANQRNGVQLAASQASSSANLRMEIALTWCGGAGFVYSSIRLFVYSSIRLFVYSSIRLFVYSSIRAFSVYQSTTDPSSG